MTTAIETLASRIASAQAGGLVAKWDHLTREPDGRVSEVRCKGCGVRIRRLTALRDENGRRYQVSLPEPNYAEMVILLDDMPDSRHVTHVCRDCAGRHWTPAALEAFFLCDVAAWTHRPGALTDPSQRALFEMQAHRHARAWRMPDHPSESPHQGGDPAAEAL